MHCNSAQTERDTIEVISYLKKEDAEKVKELENLRQQLRKQRMETSKERDLLTEEYSQRINRLEVGLHEKEDEVYKRAIWFRSHYCSLKVLYHRCWLVSRIISKPNPPTFC